MYKRISELLAARGVNLFAPIPLSACRVTRGYLLEREGISDGTAVMLAVPYYTTACDAAKHISAYAVSGDYHLFFSDLFDGVLSVLKNEFPDTRFCGFADHSPIDERDASARAGLGVIGKNGMLITERYSSYVFLGELIFDKALCEVQSALPEPRFCDGCGACRRACPMSDGLDCLSVVTQKKGELSESECSYIRRYGSAWGCDICQRACPHTVRALESGSIYTDITFFTDTALPDPDYHAVAAMSDRQLATRAYSWRGREVILRNLKIIGEMQHQKKQ